MNMSTKHGPVKRLRSITGTVLITLGGLLLLGSSSAKFAHVSGVVAQLAHVGIAGEKLTFVAALELLSALLFLTPPTRSAGLLFVSSFLGGAIATHLQHEQSIVAPSMVLLLVWVGTLLRHPQMLWSWTLPATPKTSAGVFRH